MPEIIKKINIIKETTYKTLGSISKKIVNGSTPPGGIFESKGILYYRSQDISIYEMKKSQYITLEFDEELKRSRCCEGDILVAVVGSVGKIGYIYNNDLMGNISQNLAKISINDNNFIPKYVAIFLDSLLGQIQLFRLATKTTHLYINNLQLSKVLIPKLDKSIQQKIIEIMDIAYETKQRKENEAKQLIESINNYILNELGIDIPKEEEDSLENRMFYVDSNNVLDSRFDVFYHKTSYNKYENAILNCKFKAKKLGDFITYITYGASINNCYVDSGIPLLRIKNLNENELNSNEMVYLPTDLESKLSSSKVNTGDLLISRSGSIGICSVVDKKHNNFAFGSFMIKFIINNLNSEYVSYVINSIIGKKYFEKNKIGTVQENITIPIIKSFYIPIPDDGKQNEIVLQIKNIRLKAKQLEKEAEEIVRIAKEKVEKILLEGNL
ncbi:restriction endonuclease subunit S [[Clostridium] colinum]|uniref:restriction endonuclease subunit S n=1 Tax=[Clostridium] colinum TaxID=36835 RepID=UPI00202449B9|nr:restriction endonuclease subunit S [[Clostridium] colinum]